MQLKEYNQNIYQNIYCDSLELPYNVMKKTFAMVSYVSLKDSYRGSAWKVNSCYT